MSTDTNNGVGISSTAIGSFLTSLPQSALTSAPPSHLPTALPLAFPSTAHHVNFLATLHLVNSIFTRPSHASYFAETNSTPGETSLRGLIGMFLASDAGWDTGNFLSAKAWGNGELSEGKCAEFFSIELMRERQHESLPVKVGERFVPGVELAADLVQMFLELGMSLNASCIGEDVVALLTVAKEQSLAEPDPGLAFAKHFCHFALDVIPSLSDPYSDPPGTVIPAAPLKLLQDLAHQFGSNNPDVPLPTLESLANVSPLPLPVGLLLHLGIIFPSDSLVGGPELRHTSGDWWAGRKPDLFSAAGPTAGAPPKVVNVPSKTLDSLLQSSVDACREITSHAAFGPADEADWKRKLTMLDVSRICASLDEVMDAHGVGVRIVPGDEELARVD